MDETIDLDGSFLPLAQATVPLLDSGFIFGDGVHEVVSLYSGQPFRLDELLSRPAKGLEAETRSTRTDAMTSARAWS